MEQNYNNNNQGYNQQNQNYNQGGYQQSQGYNPENYGQPSSNGQGFAITCLVCGIVSIVLCWCYGIIGLACGIVAIVMRNKFRNLNGGYVNSMVKAGFICACVGISLSALSLVYYILIFARVFGSFNYLSYYL